MKPKNGCVYIFSNPAYKKALKVGRTSDLPEVRAKRLSSSTGVLEDFKHEWSRQVPNIILAEHMLHHVLFPYAYKKEYFKIPLGDAIKICEEAMDRLFKPLKALQNAHPPSLKELKKEGLKLEKLFSVSDKNASIIDNKKLERLKKKAIELKRKSINMDSNESEQKSGIAIVPLGEKNISWEMVAESLHYPFGKKALELCLKEGKTGDPLRKRFISYRSRFLGMERIDLFFTKKHLLVNIKTSTPSESKKIIKENFGSNYSKLNISDWKYGFSFKIYTPERFKELQSFLMMGESINVPVVRM